MDEWQCCKATRDQCHQEPNGDNSTSTSNQLTESYNTEEFLAIKEKIKEVYSFEIKYNEKKNHLIH